MPLCPCRACAQLGHSRNYSERQVFRHKARYGVLGVSVCGGPLEAAPAASHVAGPESFIVDPEVLPDIFQAPEVLLDIPHDVIPESLAVGANYDDQVFAGDDSPRGPGRPRNAFIVHDPARLELLLDMCTKHNLTCDGEIAFFYLHSLIFFSVFRSSLFFDLSALSDSLLDRFNSLSESSPLADTLGPQFTNPAARRTFLVTPIPRYPRVRACGCVPMRVQGSLRHVAACPC